MDSQTDRSTFLFFTSSNRVKIKFCMWNLRFYQAKTQSLQMKWNRFTDESLPFCCVSQAHCARSPLSLAPLLLEPQAFPADTDSATDTEEAPPHAPHQGVQGDSTQRGCGSPLFTGIPCSGSAQPSPARPSRRRDLLPLFFSAAHLGGWDRKKKQSRFIFIYIMV